MLEQFADDVVRRARQNLGATQDRWGISAKWKNGKPTSFKRKKSRRRIWGTGNLSRSIRYTLNGTKVTFSMADYGEWVDEGRRGKKDVWGIGANSSAKGMPVDKAKDFVKKLRPNKDGKFIKKTPQVMDSMAYLINRKIKWFGIAPSRFFRNAVTETLEKDENLGIEIVDSIFDR